MKSMLGRLLACLGDLTGLEYGCTNQTMHSLWPLTAAENWHEYLFCVRQAAYVKISSSPFGLSQCRSVSQVKIHLTSQIWTLDFSAHRLDIQTLAPKSDPYLPEVPEAGAPSQKRVSRSTLAVASKLSRSLSWDLQRDLRRDLSAPTL